VRIGIQIQNAADLTAILLYQAISGVLQEVQLTRKSNLIKSL